MRSGEFLLGLLDPDAPAFVAADDLAGPYADAIRHWQEIGIIGREPLAHPVPTCPHCGEGIPGRVEARWVCDGCRSPIDPCHLGAWPVDREQFFAHLAINMGLRGTPRPVDDRLWRLGAGAVDGKAVECFFHPGGPVSEAASRELGRYVRVLVLHGGTGSVSGAAGGWYPLIELFDETGRLGDISLTELVHVRGMVYFDEATGVLRVGRTQAGEVPVGSKEFYLLATLFHHPDRFVSYADLKRDVLGHTGSSDSTEEATFCQKLKSRIKKSIPAIDRLIVTTNKGDGYRLRREAEV